MMPVSALIFILSLIQLPDAPFKPSQEFEVKIDVQIKRRPRVADDDQSRVIEGKLQRTDKGEDPHVTARVRFLSLKPDEYKVKVKKHGGETVYNKKAQLNSFIDIDMGFIPDIKKGIGEREWDVLLFSDSRKAISLVRIACKEDGSLYVNGVLYGKF